MQLGLHHKGPFGTITPEKMARRAMPAFRDQKLSSTDSQFSANGREKPRASSVAFRSSFAGPFFPNCTMRSL